MDARFAMIPIAALSDRRLTYRQLVVLCALCSFREDRTSWLIYPKRQSIAERCGLHPSVISSATSDLERLGWLAKEGKGGYSRATRYTITIPETVTEYATVTHCETVAQPVTVTEVATGSSSALRNTQRVAHPATRKEERDLYEETSSDPAGFSDCWSVYPKRDGGNNRNAALKAYRARLRAGASAVEMLAGVNRYAAFCKAKGLVGGPYVKQAATFFGPDQHWLEAWDVPADLAAADDRAWLKELVV